MENKEAVKCYTFEAQRKWEIKGNIDKAFWTEKEMEEFRETFYDYYTHEEILQHVIQYIIRFGTDDFVEGFGYIKVNGSYPVLLKPIKEEEKCKSIELFIKDTDPDVEFW